MRRSSKVWPLLLVFALMSTAACGDDDDDSAGGTGSEGGSGDASDDPSGEASPDLGEVTVVVGTESFEFLPAFFGHELGVWEERGLTVDEVNVGGGGGIGQALAAGEGDLALPGGISIVVPIVQGLDAKIVSNINDNFGQMVMVVSEGSDIEDIGDLRGETIGITSQGSITDYLVGVVAEQEGWAPDEIERAPVGGLPEQVAALESGATTAFIWSAEGTYGLEERGEGQILFDFAELVPDNVFVAVAATGDAIENKPEAVQAYVDGFLETTAYMKENSEETIEFCMDRLALSQFVCESTYEQNMANFSDDGVIGDAKLEGLAESVVGAGIEEPPAVSLFWDDQFVPAG